EPRLPGPEPGVLPLDDPAPGSLRSSKIVAGLRLETVDRDEALLRLGVEAGDDLDVLLENGAAELRLQELVHLVDARRVDHVDLDHDRPLRAVRDHDLLDG